MWWIGGRKFKLPFIIFLTITVIYLPYLSAASIAILGDSISTGAAVHPEIYYDSLMIWNVFTKRKLLELNADHLTDTSFYNKIDLNKKPIRLPLSKREYRNGFMWVAHNLFHIFSILYLDTEEYSWGNLFAHQLDSQQTKVLIAAKDGVKVGDFKNQVDRILDFDRGLLPDKILVFFTGNDLCDFSFHNLTTEEHYYSILLEGLQYLVRNGNSAPNGTDIYLMGFLGVLQLIDSNAILQKQISAHGRTMSCKELHDYSQNNVMMDAEQLRKSPDYLYAYKFLPKSPAFFCPTLFGKSIDVGANTDHKVMIANRIRSYRKAAQKAVGDFMTQQLKKTANNIRIFYIADTENLIFEPQDIANDCFHLSIKGQAKIATLVWDFIKRN